MGQLGRTILLVGAGCSVSAGIPGAPAIAKRMAVEMCERFGCADATDPLAAYRELVEQGYLSDAGKGRPLADQTETVVDWYGVYDEMFRRHYATPDETRDLFGRLVNETEGAMNWAHLCIGELAQRGFFSTVLTTNFDQLVLAGMVMAGLLPVVCDGIESLNRISGAPMHPQLIELHGSRHTYLLRNRPEDVAALLSNAHVSGAIQNLLQTAITFVVVGYEGREAGVMDLLVQAAKGFPDKHLFWVQHSAKPDALGEKPREFLATSRNARLLVDQDADTFFLELCTALKVGPPTAVSEPLAIVQRTLTRIETSSVRNEDIRTEIATARARAKTIETALANAPSNLDTRIARIRELRLGGEIKEAYLLAEKLLGQ